MTYLNEFKTIIADYRKLKSSMETLEVQTKRLDLQKNQLELELARIREVEKLLIDKIVQETGKEPDFYEIAQQLKLDLYETN